MTDASPAWSPLAALRRLRAAWRAARAIDRHSGARFATWAPPGHFYSPLPSLDRVRARDAAIFGAVPRDIPGVDLREGAQLALLDALGAHASRIPYGTPAEKNARYRRGNPAFGDADATFLFAMLAHLRPHRVIEVGSGHSSCVILDADELVLGARTECTFVEPRPELLRSLLRPEDLARVRVVASGLEEVDTTLFAQLDAGDVLFIDSTHVAKIDSDVNHLFFRILPALKPGVFVHVHDIQFPFEYPRDWVLEGRAWNESYLLRAFLQWNAEFRIEAWVDWLLREAHARVAAALPLAATSGGGSLWLSRIAPSAPPFAPKR